MGEKKTDNHQKQLHQTEWRQMGSVEEKTDATARAERLLQRARDDIAAVDEQLAELMAKRCRHYADVYDAKRVLGLPIKNTAVEVLKIKAAAKKAKNVVEKNTVIGAVRAIMRASRAYHYNRRYEAEGKLPPAYMPHRFQQIIPDYKIVISQGEETSHAAAAARLLFPEAALMHTRTFAGAVSQVADNIAPVAVLPLENTTAGTVDEVYRLLEHSSLYIIRSIDVSIRHYLCTLPGTKLGNIRRVLSHPQALEQCSVFIKTMGWKAESVGNTAFAARQVAERNDKTVAALASKKAAEINELDIMNVTVSNDSQNTTRFVAVSGEPVVTDDADTLSLIVRLPHQEGSLAEFLGFLSCYGLNLKKILSRPVSERPWEYSFYIDIEARRGDEHVMEAVSALASELDAVHFIGWYRQADESINA